MTFEWHCGRVSEELNPRGVTQAAPSPPRCAMLERAPGHRWAGWARAPGVSHLCQAGWWSCPRPSTNQSRAKTAAGSQDATEIMATMRSVTSAYLSYSQLLLWDLWDGLWKDHFPGFLGFFYQFALDMCFFSQASFFGFSTLSWICFKTKTVWFERYRSIPSPSAENSPHTFPFNPVPSFGSSSRNKVDEKAILH